MPANLVSIAYRESEGVPWHRFGNPIGGFMRAEDMAVAAEMDFEIRLLELVANLPDGSLYNTGDGAIFANLKGGWRHISTVKKAKNYQVVQNMDIARVLDARVDDDHPALTDLFEMDTAGVLDGGKYMFFSLKMDEGSVKIGIDGKDDYIMYMIVLQNFIDHTIEWDLAYTRPVCTNTILRAMSEATNLGTQWSFSHRGNPMGMLRYRAALEMAVQAERAQMYAQLEQMARTSWADDDVDTFVEKMYPLPPVPKTVKQRDAGRGLVPDDVIAPVEELAGIAEKQFVANTERAKDNQTGLRELTYTYADQFSDLTKYCGFQAGTEWFNWREPERGTIRDIGQSVMFAARRVENDRLLRVLGMVPNRKVGAREEVD